MNIQREVFICECCNPEHQFVVVKYPEMLGDDEEVYVSVLLSEDLDFFSRVVEAFKYIFCLKPKGYFTETLLTKENRLKLIKLLK